MPVFSSVDFESFYSSKDGYTLRSMSTHDYVFSPKFDPYLVAIVTSEGHRYVGDPLQADWSVLNGTICCIHNAFFDMLIITRLQKDGLIPSDLSFEICDTADLAAYMRCKRDLKSACKYLLGKEISKAVRTKMDGVRFQSLTDELQDEVVRYAADDGIFSMEIGQKYYDQWPEKERALSKLNREAGWRGIRVDHEGVSDGISTLHTVRDTAESRMPWVKAGLSAGSIPAFRRTAAEAGLEVPASLDKKDPVFKKWAAEHSEKYEWIKARQDHAATNGHLKRLIALRDFSYGDDHIFPIQIKYCGATATGRFSGGQEEGSESGGKFNPQNLAKFPLVVDERTCSFTKDPRKKPYEETLPLGLREINLRGYLRPLPGRLFFIADYAQIEARIVQWLAGNTKFIGLIAKEGNIYQAFAKLVGWYPMAGTNLKKEDPSLYALSKACLAHGTLVLVRSGLTTVSYKRIEDVQLEDEVWNGSEWVRHQGVVCNGVRDTMVYAGVECTPDHRWFNGEDWEHAVSGSREASAFSWAESARPEGAGLWALACGIGRSLSYEIYVSCRVCLPRLWKNGIDRLVQFKARKVDALQRLYQKAVRRDTGTPGLGETHGRVRHAAVRTVAPDGVPVYEPGRPAVAQLRR